MLLHTLKNHTGIIITALFMASCGSSQQQGPQQAGLQAVPVTLDTVKSTDAVYHDEYPGTVVAFNQVDIRAQVSGYVTGLFFKDGDKVSKGQKLYTIDAQVYDANYQQAQANLQVQETNLLKVQKDADRYHELDKHDAIAKQQVDYADAALEAAHKQVSAAKAAVNSMKSNLGFTTIYAPFSGTIGISQVKQGAAVVAGQTILNTVSTDNPMAVDFAVNQQELYRFTQLQQKGGKDSTFTLAFGTAVYPANGTISMIDRAVDPQTSTIRTRLSFPNDKGMLKAGMSATVRVLNQASSHAVMIPYKAITEQLGEFFVYVVGDSSKVNQRKVQLGTQIGNNVIVQSGLNAGEKIAVQGVQNLREGAVITTAVKGKSQK